MSENEAIKITEGLKPCPWCKSTNVVYNGVFVTCYDCFKGLHGSPDEWNKLPREDFTFTPTLENMKFYKSWHDGDTK